ncbi:hypothetical protein BDR03DRAFT_973860 [Suillus americanus]|nr:hypothetical protein BDR03DRAFT_973860 [Suillus americanus]
MWSPYHQQTTDFHRPYGGFISPVPSTLLPQQPHNVSYAARSMSALSPSCGMRQDVSVFESSKEWQRTQWSCAGGEIS